MATIRIAINPIQCSVTEWYVLNPGKATPITPDRTLVWVEIGDSVQVPCGWLGWPGFCELLYRISSAPRHRSPLV